MNDRSKSSSAEKDDVDNNYAETEQLLMFRREEGKEEEALDTFENHQ